ncbi:DUF6481 family protein [Sphingobium sp. BYY-5]|uniref:DUF6481 family protein n=1 Tax=Sphingobium sp. BYY-5 TaxID=2926400 RepID=UPI001FA704D2|nr:DUF6481 family protein [Sphingobium sp. BYY-5]MCI4592286.1 DUF6481 family protein [Sphingobium sp. BYY-5]
MRGYKAPGFQDRTTAARDAKQKALDQLRDKPPIDQAEQAKRQANRLAKETAARERREATLRDREAAKLAKRAETLQHTTAVAEAAPKTVALTDAERKAARDARYAARKARK